MPPVEANIEQLTDDLAKGNLLGDEAEAAQKLIDEATAAAEEEAAKKKAEEEELAKSKMTDDEKAAAEKKAEEEKAEADKKAEEEKAESDEKAAKEAYEKLSDEEKAEADKKAAEDAEAAKQAERDERNKNIKIPKFRLDAATARARKAEAERDELQLKLVEAEKGKADDKTLSAAEQHDKTLADLDAKIAEAMKDGNSDEVAKLMAESRTAERGYQSEVNATNLQASSDNTRAQVDETTLVNSILDQLEEQFPMFDENSDQFNADANADVLKVQRGLIAAGDTAADALVEAVNMVLPKYGVTLEEDTSTSEKDAEAAKKLEAEKKATADKKKQVEKNLDTSGKMPPDMDNAGDDSDAAGPQGDLPNVLDLTDAEYDALPEATRKAMRGDNY